MGRAGSFEPRMVSEETHGVAFVGGLWRTGCSAVSLLASQIALQFPYRFWDSKVQGADFFGHVPPSASQRGLFAVFYDMDPQVRFWGMV